MNFPLDASGHGSDCRPAARGCVVLDQPQHIETGGIRLIPATILLRSCCGWSATQPRSGQCLNLRRFRSGVNYLRVFTHC